jgi:photosystem II stability/assembly factor-like uncharacterized protein
LTNEVVTLYQWNYLRAATVALLAAMLVSCGSRTSSSSAPRTRDYAAQVINPQLTGGMLGAGDGSLLVWGTDGSVLHSREGSQWQRASVPTPSDLHDIAANEDRLLVAVGKQGAILRSEDGGRAWSSVAANQAVDLRTAVYHPASRAWLAAGTNGTLLRSTDQARTWRSIASNIVSSFETLFVDAKRETLLLGGEEGVIGRSEDGGVTWIFTAVPMPAPVTPVTGFYRYDELLLATSALGRLLVSRDGGTQWSLLQTESNGYFTGAAFDPEQRAIVLTTHNGQVLRSLDNGVSWQRSVVTENYISAIRYDERNEALLIAGHHGLLARSRDGGSSWQMIAADSSADLNVLLSDATGGIWVAAGEGGCILRADAAAAKWQVIKPALKLNLREVLLLPEDNVLVASGELGGVLRSVDGGEDWQPIDVAYPNMSTPPNLRSLAVAPRADALIGAGPPGTIIRSTTGGQSWDIAHWTPLEAQEAFAWLLSDTASESMLAIETRSIHRSVDGGKRWTRTKLPVDRELWHAAQLKSGAIVVAGQRGIAMRSEDGTAWQAVETGVQVDLYGSYADERSGALFLLGQQGTLLRSGDTGKTWRVVTSGTTNALRRMVRHPDRDALIAFGEQGTVVRSVDGGERWQTIATDTDAELRKALVAPGGELLLVGQRGVMLRSIDAGQSWTRVATHTRRNFRSAVLDPRNGEVIVVGERIVRLVPQ